jgi:hypothetical protein
MASTKDIPAWTETDPPWHPKSSTVIGDLLPGGDSSNTGTMAKRYRSNLEVERAEGCKQR